MIAFIGIPMAILGLSLLFSEGSAGLMTLGIVLVCVIVGALGWTVYYCKFAGGNEKMIESMTKRETKRKAVEDLPDDMETLKAKIAALEAHTGIPSGEAEE